jgi:hypothetical protein
VFSARQKILTFRHSGQRRAREFEHYLKSRSGCAFAARHFGDAGPLTAFARPAFGREQLAPPPESAPG